MIWRGDEMKRRKVLSLLAGALVPWSLSASTQQAERIRVIGVLIGLAEDDPDVPRRIASFEQGLREFGWVKGRNVQIHYRMTVDTDRLRVFARELVAMQPDLIAASSSFVVIGLLQETNAIPIVFVTAADPVGDGFVQSLGHPRGNVTGFTNMLSSMGGKWLELLKEIAPRIRCVAVMFNPETAPGKGGYFLPPFEAAATAMGVRPVAMPVRTPAGISNALAEFGRDLENGLVVMPDNYMSVHREVIIENAARYRVPAVYPFRYFATDGGLMSYGADLMDLYRRTSLYVDRILKGLKPAQLPVQAPAKMDMILNLNAAKTLGLSVTKIMIARANEVIE